MLSLKDLIGLGSALTAWLYFTGFSYLYHYYIFFGIQIPEVEPSYQFVLMHALSPYVQYFGPVTMLILLVILVVSVFIIMKYFPSLDHPAFYLILLFSLFIISYFSSADAGYKRALAVWCEAGRIVKFTLAEKPETAPEEFSKLNATWSLRYLFSSSSVHYAFKLSYPCSRGRRADGVIFKVPVGDVQNLVLIRKGG